jgi:hypothetical protein
VSAAGRNRASRDRVRCEAERVALAARIKADQDALIAERMAARRVMLAAEADVLARRRARDLREAEARQKVREMRG